MSGVDAAQAVWEVLGGPGRLADLPSPDQLPDAVVTSSIPVVDLRLAGLVSAMEEVATRLETAAFEASEGPRGAYEFFVDLEKDLGTWAQDIRDAIAEVLS